MTPPANDQPGNYKPSHFPSHLLPITKDQQTERRSLLLHPSGKHTDWDVTSPIYCRPIYSVLYKLAGAAGHYAVVFDQLHNEQASSTGSSRYVCGFSFGQV